MSILEIVSCTLMRLLFRTCLIAATSCAATADSASIVIHPKQILGQKNPLFFGGNNIYPDGGQGLFNPDGTYNHKVLELNKFLGIKTYRFPGGSEANLYRWKRGIGPVSARPNNVSGNFMSPRANNFGTDEFGRLLEKTGFSEGLIMVAYGYEKPQNAADWVEYMNSPVGKNPNGGIDWALVRAKNGHPQPYNIKYWEIGNEVYGNWELNWGSYPTQGDAKRGQGTEPFGDAERYIIGGKVYFTDQLAVTHDSWIEADVVLRGKANETRYVKFPPISLDNPSRPLLVRVDGKLWSRVDRFKPSADAHYVVDPIEGKITFGDGVNGRLPPAGALVSVDYESGPQPGFVDYYRAMKAVDPNIKVISCFEKESFYKAAAKHHVPYDGVARHYYPWAGRNAKGKTQFAWSVLRSKRITDAVVAHKNFLAKYAHPQLPADIDLWFTEYRADGFIGNAVVFHSLINNHINDVGSILIHSLYRPNSHIIDTKKGIIYSKGLAIPAFSVHSEDNFVKTTVATDSYHFQGEKIPNIFATASTSQNQRKVSIVITNTREDKDIEVALDLSQLQLPLSDYSGKLIVVNSNAGAMAENSNKSPNRIAMRKPIDTVISKRMHITAARSSITILKLQATQIL